MRSVQEWIGKSDDEAVPPRVRIRVFERYKGKCAKCDQRILVNWTCDHIHALINGGENRENNLQPLCRRCEPAKTADDVAEKSKVYRKKLSHLGLKKPKGRPMAGTKRSGLRKRMDGTVERR